MISQAYFGYLLWLTIASGMGLGESVRVMSTKRLELMIG